MRLHRALVPFCAWAGYCLVGIVALAWYANPLTAVLLTNAWMFCFSK
jgi:hypothetical protein